MTLDQRIAEIANLNTPSYDFTQHFVNAIREAIADPAIVEHIRRSAWLPIESAPKGKKVIVSYKNTFGKWRRTLAIYFLPDTLESEHTESGFADEGWYESSEEYEELAALEFVPLLWAELPPLPETENGE
jgi:hypothetical protein